MAKKVILAVAGAGKTYHICHNFDENKRNLILAFTHENINNINRELFDAHGRIPKILQFQHLIHLFTIISFFHMNIPSLSSLASWISKALVLQLYLLRPQQLNQRKDISRTHVIRVKNI